MTDTVKPEQRWTWAELVDPMFGVTGADQAPQTTAARREAARWIAEHGFPDKKHEDWRYFDLKALLSPSVSPAGGPHPQLTAVELASMAGEGLGGPRLVVVNGRWSVALSTADDLPGGMRVSTLESTTPASWRSSYLHAFQALNELLTPAVCLVEIALDTVTEVPIEIVYLTVGGDEMLLASPRTIISVGAGSSATVVERYLGNPEGRSLTNAYTCVVLGAGARVDHYKFQAEPDDAVHLSTLHVQPGQGAVFASHLIAVGAARARHEVDAQLAAEGARVDLDGLYLVDGDRCHDNPVLVEHLCGGCASDVVYKGIVDDAGQGIFNGRAVVHPGAAGTDANQTNKNLLLSDRAEVDTRPRLEIYADDVSCTHGAAVGQLDPDALFYLRSRGIPETAARSLLISGFAEEILCRYECPAAAEQARRIVAARLDLEDLVR